MRHQRQERAVVAVQRDELTPIEEAHAYAQLAAFPDWTVERIARTAGRDQTHVRRSIEASKLTSDVQTPVIRGELTLAEAAEIEAFADEPGTYQRLVKAAGQPGFRHTLSVVQREQAIARRADEVLAELQAAGVTVIAKPIGFDNVECELRYLSDGEDGSDIDAQDHAGCPGHAAYIDQWQGEAVYLCRDPKANGHLTEKWYGHLTDEEAETWAAEEEATRACDAALEAAALARKAFVREQIAAKKPPAGTLRLAVEAILTADAVDLDSPDEIAW
jgi:ParB family chromosome partitioning protein